jgi:hypothetical protein
MRYMKLEFCLGPFLISLIEVNGDLGDFDLGDFDLGDFDLGDVVSPMSWGDKDVRAKHTETPVYGSQNGPLLCHGTRYTSRGYVTEWL